MIVVSLTAQFLTVWLVLRRQVAQLVAQVLVSTLITAPVLLAQYQIVSFVLIITFVLYAKLATLSVLTLLSASLPFVLFHAQPVYQTQPLAQPAFRLHIIPFRHLMELVTPVMQLTV